MRERLPRLYLVVVIWSLLLAVLLDLTLLALLVTGFAGVVGRGDYLQDSVLRIAGVEGMITAPFLGLVYAANFLLRRTPPAR